MPPSLDSREPSGVASAGGRLAELVVSGFRQRFLFVHQSLIVAMLPCPAAARSSRPRHVVCQAANIPIRIRAAIPECGCSVLRAMVTVTGSVTMTT